MTYSHFTNKKCEGYKDEISSRQAQKTTRTMKNYVLCDVIYASYM